MLASPSLSDHTNEAIRLILNSVETLNKRSKSIDNPLLTNQEALDCEIHELSAVLKAFQGGIKCRLQVLRQQRNQLCSSFYQLPNEVIAQIFKEALIESCDSDKSPGALIRCLGRLSRRCREVVKSNPTLWDTVSKELGRNTRFLNSIHTCNELTISSGKGYSLDFSGLHGDQCHPTAYHVTSCDKPIHFAGLLGNLLEQSLAPHQFSNLRSLTLHGKNNLESTSLFLSGFLFGLPLLEKLCLFELFQAQDALMQILISHIKGPAYRDAEICCPKLHTLELKTCHIRRDVLLTFVEDRSHNSLVTPLRRLKIEGSYGVASIDAVLRIEELIGKSSFTWDGYGYLAGLMEDSDSESEAVFTDEEDNVGFGFEDISTSSDNILFRISEDRQGENLGTNNNPDPDWTLGDDDGDDDDDDGTGDDDSIENLSYWSEQEDGMPQWHVLAHDLLPDDL